jgi:hypothetical protein
LCTVIAEHDTSINVRRGIDLGVVQKEENGAENGFNGVEWTPTLASRLSRLLVLAGSVKDGDAELAVGVDIWVVDWAEELEGWRKERVFVGKGHFSLPKTLVVVARMEWRQIRYLEVTTVESAILVNDHQGNVPLE